MPNQLLALWGLIGPAALFGIYVHVIYRLDPQPDGVSGNLIPGWIGYVVFVVCFVAGVLAIGLLARRDWIARGLLYLYLVAMPPFILFAGFWVACMHTSCF